MRSPYPWHYTLRWLYYYLYPSTKNHTGLVPIPAAGELAPRVGRTARLVFFGDLMCTHHDVVPEVAPELRRVFEQAELIVGNLEAPIIFEAPRPDATYFGHFAMARGFLASFLEALGAAPGKVALSLANNHILDRGTDGVRSTIEHLEHLGATPLGAEADALPVRVAEVAGLRVGLAGWTRWMNDERHRHRGLVRRTPEIEGVDWADVRRRLALDVLVGTPHWEYEWQHYPRAESRGLARNLLGRGFDIVAGHHPHVLQPLERFERGLCAYSLGNLNGPPKKRAGWPVRLIALLEVEVLTEGASKGQLQSWRVHPFAQEIGPLGEVVRLMPLADAGALAPRLEQRFRLLFPGP